LKPDLGLICFSIWWISKMGYGVTTSEIHIKHSQALTLRFFRLASPLAKKYLSAPEELKIF